MTNDVRNTSTKRIERRAAMASVIGTTIEWYDFFIYGTAAALIFPKLFFGSDTSEGLMESFATIFVGFLSRPLGAVLFGHVGDMSLSKPSWSRATPPPTIGGPSSSA